MRHYSPCILIFLLLMTASICAGQASHPSLGQFSFLSDVGKPRIPGKVCYEIPGEQYLLEGSGANIWFGEDSFSYLWKHMQGDFILQGRAAFIGEGVNPHRKAGLMIRSGLEAGAAHVSCVIHGDGLTALQYRRRAGEDMEEIKFGNDGPDVLQLERKGDLFIMSVARFGDSYFSDSLHLELDEELMAGLFICSHEEEISEQISFSSVKCFGTAPEDFAPYEDYIDSFLEVLEVETGKREVQAILPGQWEAPNWTPDGKALIGNSGGKLYRFDMATGESSEIPSGFAIHNNNDHVISPDGHSLAISHHCEEDQGQSVIYTLPLEGGEPQRITSQTPSYLHGWSPDGRHLVYTAGREGAYNIFRIPSTGGEEEQLTFEATLDDGPEYSPDGAHIYFNSCRTGTMQIWRMKADGSQPEQLWDDEYNDWFPHLSPDGKRLVFISYPPEVAANDHPYYQRVYLRHMDLNTMKVTVLAYLYGGQGSLNVPSWSPDGKKIALVSNGIWFK